MFHTFKSDWRTKIYRLARRATRSPSSMTELERQQAYRLLAFAEGRTPPLPPGYRGYHRRLMGFSLINPDGTHRQALLTPQLIGQPVELCLLTDRLPGRAAIEVVSLELAQVLGTLHPDHAPAPEEMAAGRVQAWISQVQRENLGQRVATLWLEIAPEGQVHPAREQQDPRFGF